MPIGYRAAGVASRDAQVIAVPSQIPQFVPQLVEVAPRDGLQNESADLSTPTKAELIARIVASGVKRIEVASFVHPGKVPKMADAEEVVASLPRVDSVGYIGLALNARGVERAIEAGVDEINFVVVATDTFNQRNQGVSTAESADAWASAAGVIQAAGVRATVTIAAAFGCPFEGEVPVNRVVALASQLAAAGPAEVALADTIGVACPSDVIERVEAVRNGIGAIPLRCHFHNARNTGLANAYAAVVAGVAALDASVGGIGGCPFAPAATGNIPTEDLAYMLSRMDALGSVSLDRLMETAAWLGDKLGKQVPGMLSRAGGFPGQRQAS